MHDLIKDSGAESNMVYVLGGCDSRGSGVAAGVGGSGGFGGADEASFKALGLQTASSSG
jgi:hypothetical protein